MTEKEKRKTKKKNPRQEGKESCNFCGKIKSLGDEEGGIMVKI